MFTISFIFSFSLLGKFVGLNATRTSRESVLFQPVLKAYPTRHSWIITAHISVGKLNKQLRAFSKQRSTARTVLTTLQGLNYPFVPEYMVAALQTEVSNLESIFESYQPVITAAIDLFKTQPTFDGINPYTKSRTKRSLLQF